MAETLTTVRSPEDLEGLLAASRERPVMLLKHSTRCPASALAHEEFGRYTRGAASRGVTSALLLVVEDRPTSLEAARRLGVPHASPQAILIRDGRAVWSASHGGVTRKALEEAEGLAVHRRSAAGGRSS